MATDGCVCSFRALNLLGHSIQAFYAIGHSRLEPSRFLTPPPIADYRNTPVNALGYLHVTFTVDDIDETLARLRMRGAQLVGEVVQYEDAYRLCYIRGLEGCSSGSLSSLGNAFLHWRSSVSAVRQAYGRVRDIHWHRTNRFLSMWPKAKR